ncbi:MAG: VOC family protein [Nitrospirae bacterium]|nr:VOC family protein [Nitrospirota bacterium]
MIQYAGINHIALATNDMDVTIRFWRDLLGMRLVAGLGEGRSRQYFFEIAKNCMISFFEWPEVGPLPDRDPGTPVKGPFSFDHICIELSGQEELWTLKDRLEAADIWVTEVMDNGFIHSIFSTDPNNIQLEFCYKVKGMDLSANPRMIDPDPSEITLEGPAPQLNKWPQVNTPTPLQDRKIYPGVLKKLADGHS